MTLPSGTAWLSWELQETPLQPLRVLEGLLWGSASLRPGTSGGMSQDPLLLALHAALVPGH